MKAAMDNVYGNVIKVSDGGLKDPEVRTITEEHLRRNYDETVAALGKPLRDFQIIEKWHQPSYPVSEKQMREWSWDEEEIRETLAWQDEQTWPMYYDYLAWRARDGGAEVEGVKP